MEAHLLDVSLDLYGREATVSFVDWVRGNVAFDGLDALIEHIRADVVRTREILAESPS